MLKKLAATLAGGAWMAGQAARGTVCSRGWLQDWQIPARAVPWNPFRCREPASSVFLS